jgi:hypothetical protein
VYVAQRQRGAKLCLHRADRNQGSGARPFETVQL